MQRRRALRAGELDRGVRFLAAPALDDREVDALGEGEQRQGVVGAERVHEPVRRRLELGELLAGHARAGVERQDRVDRGLVLVDEPGGLADTVVEDLEVRGREAPDRRALARDRDVEPHHLDRRPEAGHLGGLPVQRAEEQQQDETGALHERAAVRQRVDRRAGLRPEAQVVDEPGRQAHGAPAAQRRLEDLDRARAIAAAPEDPGHGEAGLLEEGIELEGPAVLRNRLLRRAALLQELSQEEVGESSRGSRDVLLDDPLELLARPLGVSRALQGAPQPEPRLRQGRVDVEGLR